MLMSGRKYTAPSSSYRYGFNGKENDNEVKGEGNQQDYGMRVYDPRLGKFLSVDPLIAKYPWYSPYHFAGNNPIRYIDLDGGEPQDPSANYQYNNMGNIKSFYGGEIELNDPQLGRITVRMVNDVTTKQSWFVTKKPNTNEYMYYKAADGNHQSMHIQKNKGELPTVTGGQFLSYQTPEQIEDARRARVAGAAVDMLSAGSVALFTAPALVALSPEIVTASLSTRVGSMALDYGSQVAGNLATGGGFKSFYDVNVSSVIISGINPSNSFKSIAANNLTSNIFSYSSTEGYNGIGGGKSWNTALLETGVGVLSEGFAKKLSNNLLPEQNKIMRFQSLMTETGYPATFKYQKLATQRLGQIQGTMNRLNFAGASAGNAAGNVVNPQQ